MKTGFSGYNPISGLLFYVFTFTVSLSATHPVTLITAAVCAFAYDIKLRGKKAVNTIIRLILPMAVISALINGFFNNSGETVLFTLPWGSPFTLEAVIYGLVFAVRAGSVLIWLGSF
ncbi:MAG: energy-coupling factor transporter transmembrane protein EcfT, partial [Clostridia bacterium]|nr:energy-coupling factor transporter transmembrane protein EcfT [Clostridia bacterium]